jgi:hypothetical protein
VNDDPRGASPSQTADISGRPPNRILTEYLRHYNTARPHRGIDLDVPVPASAATTTALPAGASVERVDVLGGLIHEYRRAA